ncbi:sequestosome [Acrasis kona]|uniref:Sequestosome n=1 Tax=Acrasis kona TaxID=1008807 RepID=A0AAW2ZNK2_9EUKA
MSVLKVYFNNLIRRFQIENDLTYDKLEQQVRAAFGMEREATCYEWQYEDEEKEWVSFSSDREWKDALHFFTLGSETILRIRINEKPQTERPPRQDVHHNIICDGCQQSPIIGQRFKCDTCPDFDFCGKCHASKSTNHGHAFTELTPHRHHRGRHHGHGFHGRRPWGAQRCPFKQFKDGEDTVLSCPIPLSPDNGDQVKGIQSALQGLLGKFGIDVEITSEEPKPKEEEVKQPEEKSQEQPQESKVEKEEKPAEESEDEAYVQLVDEEDDAPLIESVPEPETVQQPKVEVEKPQFAFPEHMTTLKEMGFDNVNLNQHLLKNYNGDINKVLGALLQLTGFRNH